MDWQTIGINTKKFSKICHFVILPFSADPLKKVRYPSYECLADLCTSLGGVGMVPQKINLPLILSATKEAISEKTSSSALLPSFLDQESMETNKNFSESFDHKKAPLYFMVRQATFIPDC